MFYYLVIVLFAISKPISQSGGPIVNIHQFATMNQCEQMKEEIEPMLDNLTLQAHNRVYEIKCVKIKAD